MYSEFASDVKVQSMDETLQRRFIMFLCLHCAGEFERLTDDELAFALRIETGEVTRTKEIFTRKGFLKDGKISNWNKRQFRSDNSTKRVQQFRKRKRSNDETACNVSETPSDTDTDTDTEKNITSAKPTKRSRVPRETEPEWWLDFKLAYPHRAGDQGWRRAQKAANARQSEGHTAEEFIAGARRYTAFCEATGKTGTEFVKQAASFLGPDKPFLEPWTVPQPTNGKKPPSNPYANAI